MVGISAIGFYSQVWVQAHILYRLGSRIIGSRQQREAVGSVGIDPRESWPGLMRASLLSNSAGVR